MLLITNFLELGVASRQHAANMPSPCHRDPAGMDRCEEDVIIACGLYLLAEEEKKKKLKLGS
jgi:hypothetical protein